MGKHTGTASGMETSPRRKKAQARKRRQEEARWRSLNGPVVVRKIDTPTKSEMPEE